MVICRAAKVIKPLERILLDNGIVYESNRSRKNVPSATEVMDVDDSFEQTRIVSTSSSGNSKSMSRASSSNALTSGGSNRNSTSNLKSMGSAVSLTNLSNSRNYEVNYHTIAAKPSAFPARQCFCSVCGYIGHYSCTRCGSKFCSIKCNESHKETRCFKFSM